MFSYKFLDIFLGYFVFLISRLNMNIALVKTFRKKNALQVIEQIVKLTKRGRKLQVTQEAGYHPVN